MIEDAKAVLDRIKKLLALAQDGAATAGEAEAALNRAAHLQRQAGLTDEQIAQHVRSTDGQSLHIDMGAIREQTLYCGGRIGRWDMWLAMAAAKAVGCKTYHSHRHQSRIVCYGLPADIAVAAELYQAMGKVMARLRKAWCRDHNVAVGSRDGKSYADGFCTGLIEAASKAATDAAADHTNTVPVVAGTALVVCSNALVSHAKRMAVVGYGKHVLMLRPGRSSSRVYGGSGYGAGHAAGSSQNLSRRVVK